MLDLSFTFTPLYKLDDPESISFTTPLPSYTVFRLYKPNQKWQRRRLACCQCWPLLPLDWALATSEAQAKSSPIGIFWWESGAWLRYIHNYSASYCTYQVFPTLLVCLFKILTIVALTLS